MRDDTAAILLPNGNLVIHLNLEARRELLQQFKDDYGFEDMWWFVANKLSESPSCETDTLCVTSSAVTGDLTSAPMLCTMDTGGEILKYWVFLEYESTCEISELILGNFLILTAGN